MPLDLIRVCVAVELVAQVLQRLGGGHVDAVDGGEVEDDGAQGRAGDELVG